MAQRSRTRLGPLLVLSLIASANTQAQVAPQCGGNPAQIGIDLFNWLTPARLKFLQGGQFEWATSTGLVLIPGTADWRNAFGDLSYQQLLALLNGNSAWDAAFKWVNPNIINVVNGGDFGNLFGWLNVEKLGLLQGGRWVPDKGVWITGPGVEIVPGSPDWLKFFGPHILPAHLNILFPGGGSWNDFFGWLTPDFVQQHIKPAPIWNWVPDQPINFGGWNPDIGNWFGQGKFRWLTPERIPLLRGGYFDVILNGWITGKGEVILPGTDQWKIYFGDLQTGDLLALLGGKYRWNEAFGWLTPGLLQALNGGGGQAPDWTGILGWLTPGRLQLLQGGHFDINTGNWINGQGQAIVPGTPDWVQYFGTVFGPSNLKNLFPFGGGWNDYFGWLTADWITGNINPNNRWNPPPPAPTPLPPVPNPWPPIPNGPNWGQIQIPNGLNWGQIQIPNGPNWGQIQIPGFDWSRFGVPQNFIPWFTSGQLSWLTPERLGLLQGGRWDPSISAWITGTGQHIVPGSPDWIRFFGNFGPDNLNLLFPGGAGGSWDAMFKWITPQFLQQWGSIFPAGHFGGGFIPGQGVLVPSQLLPFFQQGQMNWLTPDRFQLLQGGRWDPIGLKWYTPQGGVIVPGSPDWVKFFGDLQPQTLTQWFPNGGYWGDVFGFMKPDFFKQWNGWQQPFGGFGVNFGIPPNFVKFFNGGQLNWLNPDVANFLKDGRWDGSKWITGGGLVILPGTPQWTQYFGDFGPQNMSLLFPNGAGAWNDQFGFLYQPGFWQQWNGWKKIPMPTPQPLPPPTPIFHQGQIRIPLNARIAPYVLDLFKSGRLNWLTPGRIKLLQGGRWDAGANKWISADHKVIGFGTPEWNTYFGNFDVAGMQAMFPNGGDWDSSFGWLNNAVAQVPPEFANGEFKWDTMFLGMKTGTLGG